jgi:predicted Rossmann fold flavoprotein
MHIYDVIVVGAGPSGIMAAGRAAERGLDVCLLEKNSSLAKKLLISGKGRCNITNATDDIDEFLNNFSATGIFLKNAFFGFFNNDLIKFFEKRGLKLKVERGKRVFPASGRSIDVLRVLSAYLKDNKVRLCFRKEVKEIAKEGSLFKITTADGPDFLGHKAVIATGGISYPETGSDGFGFYIAKRLGHNVIKPRPGMVGICINAEIPKKWQGVSLKNVGCSVFADNVKIAYGFGEMLFTHFGVSGPIILDLSAGIYDALQEKKRVYISIDFKPALSSEKLNLRLLREFKAFSRKNIKNLFKHLLPSKTIKGFLESAGIDIEKKTNQVSRAERLKLLSLLKDFRFGVLATRPIDEAIVTRGGVCTKEINPKTMESRVVKGLYVIGELLDVDATTGGYNLQAAFSTGYICGDNL